MDSALKFTVPHSLSPGKTRIIGHPKLKNTEDDQKISKPYMLMIRAELGLLDICSFVHELSKHLLQMETKLPSIKLRNGSYLRELPILLGGAG